MSKLTGNWFMRLVIGLVVLLGVGSTSDGATLEVGSGKTYTTITAAITAATAGDTILVYGTITESVNNGIAVNKALIIKGSTSNPADTIVQPHGTYGSASYRVFNVTAGVTEFRNMTIRHGKTAATGAGIMSTVDTYVSNCVITLNRTTGNAISSAGIYLSTANKGLSCYDSTISDNIASGQAGGVGIGLSNASTTGLIVRCTISGNVASNGTAGYAGSSGIGIFENSTICNNTNYSTTAGAGGISLRTGGNIRNCTIVNNYTGWKGGGLGPYLTVALTTVVLESTIIAGNGAGVEGPDFFNNATATALNEKKCLIGMTNGAVQAAPIYGKPNANGSYIGSLASPQLAKVLALATNGGPTMTCALQSDSDAINHGTNLQAFANDQRGPGYPRVVGSAADIGAYEYPRTLTYVTTNFVERAQNDGQIDGAAPMVINLFNDTFVGNVNDDIVGNVVITNVPSGLTAEMILQTGKTQVVAKLTGTATAHAKENSLSNNFAVFFKSDAFTGSDAGTVVGASNYTLSVDFESTTAGGSMSYSATTFYEDALYNDGRISNNTPVRITLTGDSFNGSAGQDLVALGYVDVPSPPSGLMAKVEWVDTKHVDVTLTNRATAHGSGDSVNNFKLAFKDSAFALGNAQNVAGATNSTLSISFLAPYNNVGLAYSKTKFEEDAAFNDGRISNTVPLIISVTNDTFEGTINDNFVSQSKIEVLNLPANLTAVATMTTITNLSVTLTGNATWHNVVSNVDNLTFAFKSGAFHNTAVGSVAGATNSTLEIDYVNPVLTWSSGAFVEKRPENNGSIDPSTWVTASLKGDTFTVANGSMAGKFTDNINTVPSLGLTVTSANSSTVTVSLTGTADVHLNANDVTNLTVTFDDSAFTMGGGVNVSGYTKTNMVIDFKDPARDWYVSETNASDTTGDGTEALPYATITKAIKMSAPGDTIKVQPGTITESSGIMVTNNIYLTIMGNTANPADTIVQAHGTYDQATARVFDVRTNCTIRNMTIRHGKVTAAYAQAGGIYSTASLVVSNCVVTRNMAQAPSAYGGRGGGIYQGTASETLEVVDSMITENVATNNFGGGIDSAGTVIVRNSTVANNLAGRSYGGGIYSAGPMTLINSTVYSNVITAVGGLGGGVYCYPGANQTGLVYNCTIASNACSASGQGGGIYFNGSSATRVLKVASTIVAGNTAATGPDFCKSSTAGTTTDDNNLIGITNGLAMAFTDAETLAISGTNGSTLADAKLGPLASNGGPTMTCALESGSPAINAGANPLSLAYDQRGYNRVVSLTPDIGAYEDQTVVNQPPIINAGTDQTATFDLGPALTVNLDGTLTDDGQPSAATTQWSLESSSLGGTVTFGDSNVVDTTATFTSNGTYVLRLVADDTSYAVTDTVQIVVSINAPPVVNAGADRTVRLPWVVTLSGASVTDDGLMSGVTTKQWTVVSAPPDGNASFGDDSVVNTTVTFDTNGTYVLQLWASDGTLSASDTVTFTVNHPSPAGTLTVANDGSGDYLTIRAAIVAAQDGNTIQVIKSPHTEAAITVTNRANLTILGNTTNAADTIVQASNAYGIASARVFNVQTNCTIRNLTIQYGKATGTGYNTGAGINAAAVNGSVVVSNCVIRLNMSASSGAGIYADGSGLELMVYDATMSDNVATGAGGGVCVANSGNLTMMNSTVARNTTVSSGGGVYYGVLGGTYSNRLINCTIYSNAADKTTIDAGGGIHTSASGGGSHIINCTIVSNFNPGATRQSAGGLYNGNNLIRIMSSIIAGNMDAYGTNSPDITSFSSSITEKYNLIGVTNNANGANGAFSAANGSYVGTFADRLDAKLSPLADNGGPTMTCALDNSSPAVNHGTNILGLAYDQRGHARSVAWADMGAYETDVDLAPTVDAVVIWPVIRLPWSASLTGTLANVDGPILTQWSKQDGPGTVTFADSNAVVTTASFSEVGSYVLRLVAIEAAYSVTDTVAVTVNAASPAGVLVVSPDGSGDYLTISNAVRNAVDGDIVRVATNVLTEYNIPVIRTNIVIEGMGSTATSTIVQAHADYGSAPSRVFNVAATATNVTFRNLTIRHGNVAGQGGGIYSASGGLVVSNCVITLNKTTGTTGDGAGLYVTKALEIYRSTVSDNNANASGGGVYGNLGQLTIVDSTLSGNVSQTNGGAVYAYNAPNRTTLLNSTIYGNSCVVGNGAGVWINVAAGATSTVVNCTIYSNATAAGQGGGLWHSGNGTGKLHIESSILAGNSAVSGFDFYLSAAVATPSVEKYNLIGVTNGGIANFTPGTPNANGSYVGVIGAVIDPKLDSLADNGGPTRTCLVQADSTAVDKGSNPFTLSYDQRGAGRNRTVGLFTDIGAYESSTVINYAPTVDAGVNQTNRMPGGSSWCDVSLNGTVTEDELPSGVTTTQWSVQSGPGAVTFGDSNVVDTTASFSTNGTYVLQLWASDSALSAADTVSIVILASNVLPTVTAGVNRTNSFVSGAALLVTMTGRASDDGVPAGQTNVTWSQLSGSGTVTFSPNANVTNAVATFPTNDVYELQLVASDTALSATSTVAITINLMPEVDAGVVQTNRLPGGSSPSLVTLNGTVTDDGMPGAALLTQWRRVSGPGVVTFGDSNVVDTTASFTNAGSYVLRLWVTDSAASVSDTVDIVILASNAVPVVIAGADQSLGFVPGDTLVATLNASVTDDAVPAAATLQWGKQGGPGTVTFDPSATAEDPTATFTEAGTYILQLVADDTAFSVTDTVQIIVRTNGPPVVNAGADRTVRLPHVVTLSGASVTDDGLMSGVTNQQWSVVSTPPDGTAVFGDDSVVNTTVTFDTNGTYVLQLWASDGTLSASDTVTFAVNHASPAGTLTVADDGSGDYLSISNAIKNAQDGNIIKVIKSPHTEAGIVVSNRVGLIFEGLDGTATGTIVQAHGSYDSASDRVFEVRTNCVFRNMTIRHGKLPASARGAGIWLSSSNTFLSISNCVITRNVNAAFHGGGLYSDKAGNAVVICDSTISDNKVTSAGAHSGGGLYVAAGSLFVTNTTISGNSVAGGSGGGAFTMGATPTFVNCTIYSNAANAAASLGGGLYLSGGTVMNCTIYSNAAPGASAQGGGVYNGAAAIIVKSSIMAGNTALAGPDFYSASASVTEKYNLIGVTNTATRDSMFSLTNGSYAGSVASPLNAKVSSLADNGGPTMTCALQAGSPALDRGTNELSLAYDQRGSGYSRDKGSTDVGAYEAAGGLTYSRLTFAEKVPPNNGSISTNVPLIISMVGGSFTGSDGDNFVTGTVPKVVVTHLPENLTAVVTRVSSTNLSVILTGSALYHESVSNVTDLTFAFQDVAFAGDVASAVVSSTVANLTITFTDAGVAGYLTYSGTNFSEDALYNDGRIDNSAPVTITIANDEFVTPTLGTDLVADGKAVCLNPPAGLQAVVTYVNESQVSVTFTNRAIAHDVGDAVTDLTLAFLDGAFANGNASMVTKATNSNLRITYLAPYSNVGMSYSRTTFVEDAYYNDGRISNNVPIRITLTNDTFTGVNNDVFGTEKVVAFNVPANMTAVVTRVSITNLNVTLTGYAASHNSVSNVSDLTLAFLSAAFNNTSVDSVGGATNSGLSVSYINPTLTWIGSGFIEKLPDNNGLIDPATVRVTLKGDTFAGANGPMTGMFSANEPDSLTTVVTKTGPTNATITLTGAADLHGAADNKSDLTVTFNDTAFTMGGAAAVNGYSKNNLTITFTDVLSDLYVSNGGSDVTGDGSEGNPYKTITNALNKASAGGTIHLSGTLTERSIQVTKPYMTLLGESTATTIVQASNDYDIASDRVFYVRTNCTFQNMTIRYGKVASSGGGIYTDSKATVVVSNCVVTQNRATTGYGGGICGADSIGNNALIVYHSTISDNTAAISGGGIQLGGNNSCGAKVYNSTISGNLSTNYGGGIVANAGPLEIYSSTVCRNTALGMLSATGGGGLLLRGNNIVRNCTIVSNACPNGYGGGIGIWSTSGNVLNMESTILEGNTAGLGGPDFWNNTATITEKYNLVGTTNGNTGVRFTYGQPNPNGSWIGSADAPVISGTKALADNGGPTMTCALQADSLALDRGTNSVPFLYDQRGYDRMVSDGVDIGAHENGGDIPRGSTFRFR